MITLKTKYTKLRKLSAPFLCVIMVVCYLAVALQGMVLDIGHEIAHFWSAQPQHHLNARAHTHLHTTSTFKSEHHHTVENSHSHRVLAFFQKVLEDEKHSKGAQHTPELKLDKHCLTYFQIPKPSTFSIVRKSKFEYLETFYFLKRKVPTPPPQKYA